MRRVAATVMSGLSEACIDPEFHLITNTLCTPLRKIPSQDTGMWVPSPITGLQSTVDPALSHSLLQTNKATEDKQNPNGSAIVHTHGSSDERVGTRGRPIMIFQCRYRLEDQKSQYRLKIGQFFICNNDNYNNTE